MKNKLFITLVFALFSACVFCQGTLQFNQVILVTNSTQTVPAGKVWKAVSFWQSNVTMTSSTNFTNCNDATRHSPIRINGADYYVYGGVASGSGSSIGVVGNSFPLWLPAGTNVLTICPNHFVSIIEFNII